VREEAEARPLRVDVELAAARRRQPGDDPQQRRLPRAVRAGPADCCR
jgi:hypothetical protein